MDRRPGCTRLCRYAEHRPGAGGRFINDLDIAERKRVALIGDEVKRLLFGESQAIGKFIYVNEIPFTIVGVMTKKTQNSSYNYRDQDRVFIPATTFTSIYGVPYVSNIIFQPHDAQRSEQTIERVREVLGRKHRFDPKDTDAIWIWDTTMFDRFIGTFFFAFNIFMGVIGGFTLAVGGSASRTSCTSSSRSAPAKSASSGPWEPRAGTSWFSSWPKHS